MKRKVWFVLAATVCLGVVVASLTAVIAWQTCQLVFGRERAFLMEVPLLEAEQSLKSSVVLVPPTGLYHVSICCEEDQCLDDETRSIMVRVSGLENELKVVIGPNAQHPVYFNCDGSKLLTFYLESGKVNELAKMRWPWPHPLHYLILHRDHACCAAVASFTYGHEVESALHLNVEAVDQVTQLAPETNLTLRVERIMADF